MKRDHMMGWVMPAEPLGPAIQPKKVYTKEQRAEAKRQIDIARFETGDHMLPGMKQSDFPKEYDTGAAIEDRALGAYEQAMREMLVYGCSHPKAFGYDAGAPGGDMSAVCVRDSRGHIQSVMVGDWGKGTVTSPKYEAEQRKKNETASGLQLLMKAGEERQRRIMAAFKPKPLKWGDLFK